MEKDLITIIQENWVEIIAILAAIYELIIRIKPTLKSKSIFNYLAIIFDRILPNRAMGGSNFRLETKEPKRKEDDQ